MTKRSSLVTSNFKQSKRIYQDNKRMVILTNSGFKGLNSKLPSLYRTAYNKICFITFHFEYYLLEQTDQQNCGCCHQGYQACIGGLHKHQQSQYRCTFYEIKTISCANSSCQQLHLTVYQSSAHFSTYNEPHQGFPTSLVLSHPS